MTKKWYSIKARAVRAEGETKAAEVFIYGDIGESWWGETITAREFVKDFAAIDADQITVRINSYGGSVTDGVAIYNAIKRHPANVTISIDAAAYSIASLIAMAGDTVEMAENALLMIHAPWSVAIGNSADMREMADTLDTYARAMTSSYAKKTGMSVDDVFALLADGEDHYYTADEAKAAGFVDEVVGALPIAASASIPQAALLRYPSAAGRHPLMHAAAPAANNPPKETQAMTDKVKEQAAAPQPAAPQNTPQPSAAEVLAADKTRRAAVRAEFKPFEREPWAAELQRQCEDDDNVTAALAAQKILAKLAEGVKPVGAVHIETVEDETDKRAHAVAASLLVRASLPVSAELRAAANASQYRGHKLLDIARDSLARAGVRTDGMGQMEIVAAAFTSSTSDFPILLEDAMHKALQSAYATAPDTWSRFCGIGSVSDFRKHNRYRAGSLGNLRTVNENGEFETEAIPDGEKAEVQAGTKGYIVPLSRQMIINDDLGAFLGVSAAMGRAARRTIESDVYAVLTANSGLGPTMADTQPLFHSNRSNVGTGSAISVDGLDADRVVMGAQTDVSGNDFLDLRPSVLLVPLALGGKAREVVAAEYNDEATKNQRRPNVIRDIFDDIVDTPRLTGNRRYLFADPRIAPVIEVSFLDGVQEPYLEMEQGFTVDGTRYKVRLDFGVDVVDYRGAVTNAGQ